MKMTCIRNSVFALALCASIFCTQPTNAVVIFSEDFQGGTVGATLDSLPGWSAVGDSGTQVIGSEGSNKFATTGSQNNSASRYDHIIVNPGLNSNTKLVMTIDVYDPSVNPGGVSTFPRAYGGIFQASAGQFIPPYFGIEQDDATADTGIAEWVAAGEGFTPQHFGPADVLPQDTWFTMRAIFDLGTKSMDVYAKTRDGADPFVQVFAGVSTPFVNPNQDLNLLDVWRQRLNRGTRIDNITVAAVPEPTPWMIVLTAAMFGAIAVRRVGSDYGIGRSREKRLG
jgi:hypothetical protein